MRWRPSLAAVALLVLAVGCAAQPTTHRGAQPSGPPSVSAAGTRGDPDLPRDPAHGRYLTLHGTLRVRNGCRLLHTPAGTFALHGGGSAALPAGHVTVRGAVASGPGRCAPATPLRVVAVLG